MLHPNVNPAARAGADRVLDNIGLGSNVEDDTENLFELQADWLHRRYLITMDRARVVADLYFGGAV